ncbi:hypothetical protein SD457_06020 [Coprobacillaceae bacterium CR2/5/TPMF4]|nr:hypothetical protein SD457_06020 [Coprobacillaceae bacterium CR2/5/TPMF4]
MVIVSKILSISVTNLNTIAVTPPTKGVVVVSAYVKILLFSSVKMLLFSSNR